MRKLDESNLRLVGCSKYNRSIQITWSYRSTVSNKGNQKTVRNFYDGLNKQDWNLVASTLHKEFGPSGVKDKSIPSDWRNTSFYNFVKLLGFSQDILSFDFNSYTNKDEYIDHLKWLVNIFTNWRADSIISNNTEVWVNRIVTIITPKGMDLELHAYQMFWMKDEKILGNVGAGLHLPALLEYGSSVIRNNREDEIKQYLESLFQWGLIPEVSPLNRD